MSVVDAPASGKSTFAAKLVEQNKDPAPIDGSHLDKSTLDQSGFPDNEKGEQTHSMLTVS